MVADPSIIPDRSTPRRRLVSSKCAVGGIFHIAPGFLAIPPSEPLAELLFKDIQLVTLSVAPIVILDAVTAYIICKGTVTQTEGTAILHRIHAICDSYPTDINGKFSNKEGAIVRSTDGKVIPTWSFNCKIINNPIINDFTNFTQGQVDRTSHTEIDRITKS